MSFPSSPQPHNDPSIDPMLSQQRRRPSSSRRAPKRKRVIWYPVKLMGMGVAGIFGAVLLFQLYVKINHPFKLGEEESRKVVALRERLNRQERRNDQLETHLQYLQSEEGMETQARRAGYHRPGEEVFLLDRDAITATEATPTPPAKKSP